MKCPHCGVAIHEDFSDRIITYPGNYVAKGARRENGEEYYLNCRAATCLECSETIAYLQRATRLFGKERQFLSSTVDEFLV